NEEYNRQYKGENNMGTIVNFFTIFCLIIACLGLYGLVAFSVEKKRKEIGVRKALGASNGSIIYLFTRDFTTLLVIALLVAIPLTYMFMSDWIGNFRYHADINWFNFILAGGITVLIAICTVIIKTLKASRLDPAKTLKYE
ncbi:MAG: FtsX-like permease family protein, partial [Bacteroidota bacterium]